MISGTVIKREYRFCPCCMEDHDVLTVEDDEATIYKDVEVTFRATYEYCSNTDEYWESGKMMNENWYAMREAYDKIMNK